MEDSEWHHLRSRFSDDYVWAFWDDRFVYMKFQSAKYHVAYFKFPRNLVETSIVLGEFPWKF